jgi:hypothetical protein
MWNVVAVAVVAILFGAYALFDCLSVYARIAGSAEARNALGASFEKAMHTIKRAFLFLFPPILGVFIAFGNFGEVYASIFASYGVAFTVGLMCLVMMKPLVHRLRRSVRAYVGGKSLALSIISPSKSELSRQYRPNFSLTGVVRAVKCHARLFFYCCWIYFIYASAIFVVNVFAIEYIQYSSIIFQLIGGYNALGTLLIAFVVDPMISDHLDGRRRLSEVATVVVSAQVAVYGFISPLFFVCLLVLF